MISINHLLKKFGNKTVLQTEQFNISKGKLTAFIGPNGAGKSTLLGMMSRLLAQDGGEILIEGLAINKIKTEKLAKQLSILKQSNHLNMRVTIKELVAFGRFPHSKGRLSKNDEQKISEAIEYVGLTDIAGKHIHELSGGQRQRAFIAMVIAQDTDYILLDEPLNNLDLRHAVEVMKLLRKLVDEAGKTVIVVLHDLNFASIYADEMVAMKSGNIVAVGKKNEMMDKTLLESLYDMPLTLKEYENNKICLHYH
ncbi:iron ABC transporter ATP-binding protein [Thorsellia kenyensis]|uniref:ABC transporter ATP-binding protein n=1 Tax=Thorsellia kenyensis TaxID=1549888 RepID=A0ABV6CBE0_9GAMM